MQLCILDERGICVNVIVADDENPSFLRDGQTFAPNHEGGIGSRWENGKWVHPEQISSEQLAAEVRASRNGKLLSTDWVVTASVEKNEPVHAAWTEYRQALRDITMQPGFPHEVVWPTKPE